LPQSVLLTSQKQLQGKSVGHKVSLVVQNVFRFVGSEDVLKFTKFYVFKRYSKVVYLHDAVNVCHIATHLNTADLLATLITRGLARNQAGRKQKQFIFMLQAIIQRYVTWAQIKVKPLDWQIAVSGKVDGSLRRKTVWLRTGHVSIQQLDFWVNYSYKWVETKFGILGVKV